MGSAVIYDPCIGEALFAVGGDGIACVQRLEGIAASETAIVSAADEGDASLLGLQSAALAHASGAAVKRDLPPPVQAKLAAASAANEDALAAVGEAHEVLGAGMMVHAVTLAAQTELRASRVAKDVAKSSDGERDGGAVNEPALAAIVDALEAAAHKARYAAAIQSQLEMRAKLLRTMLKAPAMWPHTPLSASERESHAALAALSARTAELRTGVAQLGSFAHEPPPANGSSVDENEATEAALELRRQGRVLERLIAQVREARERVDEVLA